jgi:hypothetical protein
MPSRYYHFSGYWESKPGTTFVVADYDGFPHYQAFVHGKFFKKALRVASGDIEEALRAAGAHVDRLEASPYQAGEYHPRMWRPGGPKHRDTYETEWRSAQGAALNLFAEMRDVFRYVEPAGNLKAFGHEIRQLLILACTEVETQCKAILRTNHYTRLDKGGNAVDENRWCMDRDYFKVAAPLRLAGWKLRLRGYPGVPEMDPFEAWSTGLFQPLAWYGDYNKVKHDREQEFARASLENMIQAMAAIHVLISAEFGQFGNVYPYGYSELDSFDCAARRPEFSLKELYVPPTLEVSAPGTTWHPLDFKWP